MSNLDIFKNLPDIDFVNKSVDQLLDDMIAEYEKVYFEAAGEKKTLAPGDPVRIWIYSQALRIYQALILIDYTGKQNLLRYATGSTVDHIGARIGVVRLPASAAITTVRFTLSAVQANAVSIPAGTRVSSGNNVFFVTKKYAEIPAGIAHIDITVECTETGIVGNDFTVGQINILVDPIPFIETVNNIDKSQGGADIENDDSLKERIYLKPESFSVAGPKEAYEFFVREYSPSISDVNVSSPNPGEVDVRFILGAGEIPDPTIIQGVDEYLSADTKRPLTDNVIVQAPAQIDYNIDLTYFISENDKNSASSIQLAVNASINDYVIWQKSKIGRDINPSQLIFLIKQAGAKRVVVSQPVFTTIDNIQVAIEGTISIVYGGLEDE